MVGGLYGALIGDSDVVVAMLEAGAVNRVRACTCSRCGRELSDAISRVGLA